MSLLEDLAENLGHGTLRRSEELLHLVNQIEDEIPVHTHEDTGEKITLHDIALGLNSRAQTLAYAPPMLLALSAFALGGLFLGKPSLPRRLIASGVGLSVFPLWDKLQSERFMLEKCIEHYHIWAQFYYLDQKIYGEEDFTPEHVQTYRALLPYIEACEQHPDISNA